MAGNASRVAASSAATVTQASVESVAAAMIVRDLAQHAPTAPRRFEVDEHSVGHAKLLQECLDRSLAKSGLATRGTAPPKDATLTSVVVGNLRGTSASATVEITVVWAQKAGYIVRLKGNASTYKRDLLAQAKHA